MHSPLRQFVRFVRAAWLREARGGGALLFWALILATAVLMGRIANSLAAIPADRLTATDLTFIRSALVQFVPALWAVAYLVVPIRIAVLLGDDQRSAWLATVFAAGLSRRIYLAAVICAEMLLTLVVVFTGAAVYAITRSSLGPLTRFVSELPYGILALSCTALFSTLIFLFARSTDRTVAIALILIGAPFAIKFYLLVHNSPLLQYAHWAMLHVPPASRFPSPGIGQDALLYLMVAVPVVAFLAPTRFGWWHR